MPLNHRRNRGHRGFTLVETVIAVGIFGIVSLILTSTVKMSGILNITADRNTEEGMMMFDAGTALTASQLCTALLGNYALQTQGTPPTPMPAPSTPPEEISLTLGCTPQDLGTAPATASSYNQNGICRGGNYAHKINIDNVSLTNLRLLQAGSNTYQADVNIAGTKVAAEIYGTAAVARTLEVFFTVNPITNRIVSCQGAITNNPQSNCQMIGCTWNSTGNLCDCCTPLGGTPLPMPVPTACVFPAYSCTLPSGFAWRVGDYACSDPNQVNILGGSEALLSDTSPTATGQIKVACCSAAGVPISTCTAPGTVVIDSGAPNTCQLPSCTTPTSWAVGGNTCTANSVTIQAGQVQTVTTNGASPNPGQAGFLCPMVGSGGTPAGGGGTPLLVASTCGASAPIPPPTPVPSGSPMACNCPAGSGDIGSGCIITAGLPVGSGDITTVAAELAAEFPACTGAGESTVCFSPPGPEGGCPPGEVGIYATFICPYGVLGGPCAIIPTPLPPPSPSPSPTPTVAGACGPGNGATTPAAATALGLCSAGTASAVNPISASFWDWTCTGSASTATCYAGTPTSLCSPPADLEACNDCCAMGCEAEPESGTCFSTCSAGCSVTFSDARLKTDITFAGIENGHSIYRFKYKPGFSPDGKVDEYYLGVMAQEVLLTNPEAVIKMSNGYLAVRYGMIGVKFRRALRE